MTPERAAHEIRRAYGTYQTQGHNRFMMLADLVDRVDLTKDQLIAGIRHLEQTDRQFMVCPESNQKALTQRDRDAEIVIGNQRNHLIAWI